MAITSTEISNLASFKKTELFQSIELTKEEYIGDIYNVRENFNMLFDVLSGVTPTHQSLALDYYNNFRVEISYPNDITIEGKFKIVKNDRGEYEFDSNEQDNFLINDFLEQDREQIKSYTIVGMINRKTGEPLVFFDNFLQDNEKLTSGKMLKNAKYWRIPPLEHKTYTNSNKLDKSPHKVKIEVGGKRNKKRITRTKLTKRKGNKRTKRR